MKLTRNKKSKPVKKNISVFEYVSYNSPAKANAILLEYGKSGSDTREEVARQLSELFIEKGAPIMAKVLQIHPDNDVFKEIYTSGVDEEKAPVEKIKEVVEKQPAGKFVRACGCSIGVDGFVNCEGKTDCNCHLEGQKKHSNAAGDAPAKVAEPAKVETKLPEKQSFYNTTNLAILTVLAIASIAVWKSN